MFSYSYHCYHLALLPTTTNLPATTIMFGTPAIFSAGAVSADELTKNITKSPIRAVSNTGWQPHRKILAPHYWPSGRDSTTWMDNQQGIRRATLRGAQRDLFNLRRIAMLWAPLESRDSQLSNGAHNITIRRDLRGQVPPPKWSP